MLIEVIIRILIGIVDQFTEKDLQEFINKFPTEVGNKIGEAVKGNATPLKKWFKESSHNIKTFTKELFKKDKAKELASFENKTLKIEEILKVVVESIDQTKKPILIKEFFGNVQYFSLWKIQGYSTNVYAKKNGTIVFNPPFKIYLFEKDKHPFLFQKLQKNIQNNRIILPSIYKKGLKVNALSPDTAFVKNNHFLGKVFKPQHKIPLDIHLNSYLNMLADIDEHTAIVAEKPSFWGRIKNIFS